MVSLSITATNSATPSVQATLSQMRLAQARREADQAEGDAKNLRAQADAAERDAESSRKTVRQLSLQTQREASQTYAQPGQQASTSVFGMQGQTKGRIVNVSA